MNVKVSIIFDIVNFQGEYAARNAQQYKGIIQCARLICTEY